MLKVVTVLGARPQFIKASVVSAAFAETGLIEEVVIHTGQHFDKRMSDIFFEQMSMPRPKYMLDINSSGHGDMTGRMLIEIETILLQEKPDYVLVYGDTNTTLAAALAASKLHIKLAHVEAGLRSFNMRMPEEINRILTDRVSALLFCPSGVAKSNLLAEGFANFDAEVSVVGDVMYDATLAYSKFPLTNDVVASIVEMDEPYILATVHRAENTDDELRFRSIFEALDKINSEVRVVLPLHPRTKKFLELYGVSTRVKLIDPVGYIEMLKLIQGSAVVMTDSGGLQKEAYFLNKRCVILRDETEWVELLESGCALLAGADPEKIVRFYLEFSALGDIQNKIDYYGQGNAAQMIAKAVLQ